MDLQTLLNAEQTKLFTKWQAKIKALGLKNLPTADDLNTGTKIVNAGNVTDKRTLQLVLAIVAKSYPGGSISFSGKNAKVVQEVADEITDEYRKFCYDVKALYNNLPVPMTGWAFTTTNRKEKLLTLEHLLNGKYPSEECDECCGECCNGSTS